MNNTKIYIKYMTGFRCKLYVEQELKKIGVCNADVELGVVRLNEELTQEQLDQFESGLCHVGLEILNKRSSILVEKIKLLIINIIYYTFDFPKTNFSDYLSKELGYHYTYLSNTFTHEEGISIKEFIIQNKVEKIKEFLLHGEMTLTEIAYKLDYSSVAHLSNQFKSVTGYSPSRYKKLKKYKRRCVESL